MRLGKKQIAFAAALGIAAAVTAAGPASAAASRDSALVANAQGNARFYANGDKIVVCDAKADGSDVEADFDVNQNYVKTVKAAGAGKCTTYSKNLTEGTPVSFRLYNQASHLIGTGSGVA
jgi:hypothetical protein